jgi:hypothetical protein
MSSLILASTAACDSTKTSTGVAASTTTTVRHTSSPTAEQRGSTTTTSTPLAAAGAPDGPTTGGPPHLARGALDLDHPDPGLTPGAVLPGVTAAAVCASGYTATVRDVPSSLKDRVYTEYGIARPAPGAYEIDHLVALELGGSNEITNLWPEPASGPDNSHDKDAVENRLHALVCGAAISLAVAQNAIVHWDTWVDSTQTAAAPFAVPAPPTTVAPATTAPVTSAAAAAAGGATALCHDGTLSFAAHHQGACSHHGGVDVFYR